jgi:hypothetical protein
LSIINWATYSATIGVATVCTTSLPGLRGTIDAPNLLLWYTRTWTRRTRASNIACSPSAIDYQLSDPAQVSTVIFLAAGKRMSGEVAVDSNSEVRAWGALGEILSSKAVLTNF